MEKKTVSIETKIGKLPKGKKEKIMLNYDRRKLNMGSAWALWFLGRHYLHTARIGIWFLYLGLSLLGKFIRPGFVICALIRRIIQAFMLKDEINKKNEEILEMIYNENVA